MRAIKCDVPGWDFVARHEGPYVKCIIGRHKSMRHGIRGKMFKYSKQGKFEAGVVANHGIVATEPAPEPEPVNIPNFCPNCGCSIQAIMAAMNLRRRK